MEASDNKKYFTVEEANSTLPLVRAIVADIVRQFGEIRDRKERLDGIQKMHSTPERESDAFYREEVAQIEDELAKEVEVLQGYIDELDRLGVELKDYVRGLVDFLASMDGRDVYLCWQLGEEDVAHWHELDSGFSGRHSLMVDTTPKPGSQPHEIPPEH